MSDNYKAVKVSEHVWWVGAVDWPVRDFHGYETGRGSTYNAYLIMADEPILVDTVKAAFKNEMLARVASVVGDVSRVRYIISNHAELDHSGSLAQVIDEIRPEKVFVSKMGLDALGSHFDLSQDALARFQVVGDRETMKLAGVTLTFAETRMVHWPDSMFTYLAEDRLLFSQDCFGMHLAKGERFDDEVDEATLEYEAARYYANILMPYPANTRKATDYARGLNAAIIAPDHGPIWRKGIGRILDLYERWTDQRPRKKALILYDTMWQSTAAMARAIGEGLIEGGAEITVMPMRANHRSDAATEILEAGALVVGSPTINNQVFPTVADVMSYLKGLRPKNKIGAMFGSYGWAGEAPAQLAAMLKDMKIDLVGEPLRVKYVPKAKDLEACRALGLEVARKLDEIVSDAGAAPASQPVTAG